MAKANGKPHQGNGKRLRFAAFVRVSTERQEKKGESLGAQRSQILHAVQEVGGTIAEWYGGQEHATAGWERKERDRMLADAENASRPFDAVMLQHADRWSRDDTQSGADLERLKRAGIRFFVLDSEQDLFDPTIRMYLGVSAVVGAFQARNQNKKSLEVRIKRAREGIPTGGKRPLGRWWDAAAREWRIIPEKLAMIQDVAKRYLAGESLPKLANEYGVNHSNLHKVLTQRCGTEWEIEFRADDLNIHEVVNLSIPRLLPDKLIRAIRLRAEANRTYLHGRPKHEYLLSGRIFCGTCGYAMFGQTNHGNRRYYRHAHTERARKCTLDPRPWISAARIEAEVNRRLFLALGNPKAMERAMEAAIPNREKVQATQQKLARLTDELAKLRKARASTLDRNERGLIPDDETDARLDRLRTEERFLQAEIDSLSATLTNIPTKEQIRKVATRLRVEHHRLSAKYGSALIAVDEDDNEFDWEAYEETGETVMYLGGNDLSTSLAMTGPDKTDLVEYVFGSPLPDGKPAGVYVWPKGGKAHRAKSWRYRIRGIVSTDGELVMPRASS